MTFRIYLLIFPYSIRAAKVSPIVNIITNLVWGKIILGLQEKTMAVYLISIYDTKSYATSINSLYSCLNVLNLRVFAPLEVLQMDFKGPVISLIQIQTFLCKKFVCNYFWTGKSFCQLLKEVYVSKMYNHKNENISINI